MQINITQLAQPTSLAHHNPSRPGALDERIYCTTPVGDQEHRGIVRCHLDGPSHQPLMRGYREILAETLTDAFINGHHFRPWTGINPNHFSHDCLGKGQGAEIEQLAQALLLQISFLIMGELSLQHLHLALQAQVLLTHMDKVDIAIPEATEALGETSNSLL